MTDPTPTPRVAVVIPAYNSSPHIAETIESVVRQTFPSWQLVVHDDGSSDDTASIAASCAAADPEGRITVTSGSNVGVAEARNRGAEEVDGRAEFLIFLDHDDIWLPDALATLVDALDVRPHLVAAHGVARCIDEDGNEVPGDDLEESMLARRGFRVGSRTATFVSATEPTTFAALAVQNWVLTPGLLLIRRSAFDQAGGFDAATVPADDWDFAVRLSRLGGIAFVPQCLLLWRRHVGAQSNVSRRWRRAYYDVRARMLLDRANTSEQRRAARLGFRDVYLTTARETYDLLRRRRYLEGLRRFRRAVYALGRHASAEVRLRWHRSLNAQVA